MIEYKACTNCFHFCSTKSIGNMDLKRNNTKVSNMLIKTRLVLINYTNSIVEVVVQIAGRSPWCWSNSVLLVARLDHSPIQHHLISGSSTADEIDHVTSFHLPANPIALSGTSRWPTRYTAMPRVQLIPMAVPERGERLYWYQAAQNISSDAIWPFSCPIFSRKWDFLRCFSANQKASGNSFPSFIFGNCLVKHPPTHTRREQTQTTLPSCGTLSSLRCARTHTHSENNTDGIIKNTSALTLGWVLESGK